MYSVVEQGGVQWVVVEGVLFPDAGMRGFYGRRTRHVWLRCAHCGKVYAKPVARVRQNLRNEASGFFCSMSCRSTQISREVVWGDPQPGSPRRLKMLRSAVAEAQRAKSRGAYDAIAQALHEEGVVDFVFEMVLYDEKADGVFDLVVGETLILELGEDGHTPRQAQRDAEKDRLAQRLGYTLRRLPSYDPACVLRTVRLHYGRG